MLKKTAWELDLRAAWDLDLRAAWELDLRALNEEYAAEVFRPGADRGTAGGVSHRCGLVAWEPRGRHRVYWLRIA